MQIVRHEVTDHEVIVRASDTYSPARQPRRAGKPGQGIIEANRKTEICRHWRTGSCPFGAKCAFAHGAEELRNQHRDAEQARGTSTTCKTSRQVPYMAGLSTTSGSYYSRYIAAHDRSRRNTDNSGLQHASSGSALYAQPLDISNDPALHNFWQENLRRSSTQDAMGHRLSQTPSKCEQLKPQKIRSYDDHDEADDRAGFSTRHYQDTLVPSGKDIVLAHRSGNHSTAGGSLPVDDCCSFRTRRYKPHSEPVTPEPSSSAYEAPPTSSSPRTPSIGTDATIGWDPIAYDIPSSGDLTAWFCETFQKGSPGAPCSISASRQKGSNLSERGSSGAASSTSALRQKRSSDLSAPRGVRTFPEASRTFTLPEVATREWFSASPLQTGASRDTAEQVDMDGLCRAFRSNCGMRSNFSSTDSFLTESLSTDSAHGVNAATVLENDWQPLLCDQQSAYPSPKEQAGQPISTIGPTIDDLQAFSYGVDPSDIIDGTTRRSSSFW